MTTVPGFVELKAFQVSEYCEATIKRIKEIQKFDDEEFLNWAYPYYNNLRRQKWWQIWRKPKFKTLDEFKNWWQTSHYDYSIGFFFYKDNSYYSFINIKDVESFSKISNGFKQTCEMNPQNPCYTLKDWYPSNFMFKSKIDCEHLLKVAKKLDANKEMLISTLSFDTITYFIK